MSIRLEREDGNVLTSANIGDPGTILYKGDYGPASFYEGNKFVSGYEKTKVSGEGRVELGVNPYKAELPSVIVKGEGKQEKLEGKNLAIRPSENRKESNGITFELMPDGAIHAYGKLTKSYADGFVTKLALKKGMYFASDMISYVSQEEYKGGNFVLENDTDENAYWYIGIAGKIGQDIDHVSYPQIEKGSSPTPYEPYCGGIPAPNPQYPIEPEFLEGVSVVGRGKNVCSGKNVYWHNSPEFNRVAVTPFPVKRNTDYTISAKAFSQVPLFSVNASIDGINMNDKPIKASTNIFNSGDNDYIWFRAWNTNDVYGIDLNTEFQVEEGSAPTPYEPYIDLGTAPLPILRALPDGSVRDEIDLRTGTIIRMVAEVKLTGKETWIINDYLLRDFKINAYQANPLKNADREITVICSHFSTYGIWPNGMISEKYCVANSGDSLIFKTDGVQSLEEYLQLVKNLYNSGHPITIWYPLATPIIEHYDPAILRQHPGYTQLIQQGGFKSAVIDAEYYEEVKK